MMVETCWSLQNLILRFTTDHFISLLAFRWNPHPNHRKSRFRGTNSSILLCDRFKVSSCAKPLRTGTSSGRLPGGRISHDWTIVDHGDVDSSTDLNQRFHGYNMVQHHQEKDRALDTNLREKHIWVGEPSWYVCCMLICHIRWAR
jgi:hypothetical protein